MTEIRIKSIADPQLRAQAEELDLSQDGFLSMSETPSGKFDTFFQAEKLADPALEDREASSLGVRAYLQGLSVDDLFVPGGGGAELAFTKPLFVSPFVRVGVTGSVGGFGGPQAWGLYGDAGPSLTFSNPSNLLSFTVSEGFQYAYEHLADRDVSRHIAASITRAAFDLRLSEASGGIGTKLGLFGFVGAGAAALQDDNGSTKDLRVGGGATFTLAF